MKLQVREAINRGNNLLAVGVLVFVASGIFTEILVEDELLDKADDILITLMAIGAVIWYLRGKNRVQFSWTPFALLAIAFVAKVFAFLNEFSDPAAVGDEFGTVIPLAVMTIATGVILYRSRREAWPSNVPSMLGVEEGRL